MPFREFTGRRFRRFGWQNRINVSSGNHGDVTFSLLSLIIVINAEEKNAAVLSLLLGVRESRCLEVRVRLINRIMDQNP